MMSPADASRLAVLFIFVGGGPLLADAGDLRRVTALIAEVRSEAFPELAGTRIEVRSLSSESDFFRARFDLARFWCGRKMRYVILANSAVSEKGAPPDAVRAIVAHELAHVLSYQSRGRIHLFGLVRMTRPGYRRRFERGADLEAIRRGFGPGLQEYRRWLYRQVPPGKLREKQRDYLSPEEIEEQQRAR